MKPHSELIILVLLDLMKPVGYDHVRKASTQQKYIKKDLQSIKREETLLG